MKLAFGVATLPLAGRVALPVIVAAAGALAAAHYRALPPAEAVPVADVLVAGEARWPRVSIIVPARNEERTLPRLLASLCALDCPTFDIIVVDDASTDTTYAIAAASAAEHPGRVRVLRGAGPPPGWTGKSYACTLGAAAATGDWLLFTDADTEHAPTSLRMALALARRERTAALSLFTRQRCESFWERLLLPFAYQQYFVGVRPRALRRQDGPALANGQYILVSRVAYEAAGGHAAIAGSIIDDVALAGALKRAGFPVLAARGEGLVSVRMYDGWQALAEGFTKNSTQFVREQRLTGALVVLSTASAAAVLPTLVSGLLSRQPVTLTLGLAAYGAQMAGLLPWLRRFGVSRRYAPLAPLAALAFTGIAVNSAVHALTRRPVRWKGRGYASTPATRAAMAQESSHA